MPVIGIITEFNPFHNGHAHLLHTLRRQPQATLICIMSGPFTQRGEAALMSKYSRAQMALHNGADLVVELPFFYAVRSAYDFARGGIHLLHRLGIEQLGFGCETSNEFLLKTLTALLAHEPKAYTDSLHKHLKTGCGFAAARTLALQEMFPDNAPEIAQLLHAPNTILALEYLHVLQEEALPIQPQMILRQGAGYHDETLQEFASAQAIRTHLRQQASEDTMPLQKAMPPTAYTLLQQELHAGRAPFQTTLLDAMILSQLRKSHPQELATIFEMREGIENRLFKQAFSCGTIEDLVQAVSGRRYPKSRIRRLLLYTLLGLTQTQAQLYQALYAPDYVRLLAANARGLKYIQQLQRKTPAPTFLSSGREIRRFLQQTAPELSASQQMLQLDLTANNLYTLGYPQASQRSGDTDFHQSAFFL